METGKKKTFFLWAGGCFRVGWSGQGGAGIRGALWLVGYDSCSCVYYVDAIVVCSDFCFLFFF